MLSHCLVVHRYDISVITTGISLLVWIILQLIVVISIISIVAAGSRLTMRTVYAGQFFSLGSVWLSTVVDVQLGQLVLWRPQILQDILDVWA